MAYHGRRGHATRASILCLVLLSLASCGYSDEDMPKGVQNSAAGNMTFYPAPVMRPKPKPLSQVLPNAFPSPEAVSAIPLPFRGRWGAVVQDCASSSEGLTVHQTTVEQGTTRLAVSKVEQLSPTKVRFTGVGDGANGDQYLSLTLLHADATLVLDSKAPPGTARYQRCPE